MNYDNLWGFQKEAVSFLLQRPSELSGKPHRLLALPPGAGKTPITVCAANKVQIAVTTPRPAKTMLVICPATLKETWARQLVDWGFCRPQDIQILWSERDNVRLDAKVTIVNYELIISDQIYRAVSWGLYDIGVVDEAHRLKNFTSQRAKKILGGECPLIARCWVKWYLTGTPMPNRPIELYPLLKVNAPELLGRYDTKEKFGFRYCGAVQTDRGTWDFKGVSHVDELRERIKPFIMFRTLDDILPDLPEVITTDVFCHVVPVIMDEYGQTIEVDESNAYESTVRRAVGVAKIPFAVSFILDKVTNESGSLVVFAHHREVIEKVTELLNENGQRAISLYGGVTAKQKEQIKNDFIAGKYNILVAQRQTAGTGTDGLQYVSNKIISIEPDWVPGEEQQMIGRLRRIGQREIVWYDRIIAEGTMDERVMRTSDKKQRTIDRLFNQDLGEISMLELEVKRLADAAERIAAALEAQTGDAAGSPAVAPVAEAPAKGKGKGKNAAPAAASTPTTQTEAVADESADTAATKVSGNAPAVAPSAESLPSTDAVTLDFVKDKATKFIQLSMKNGKAQADAVTAIKQITATCGVETLNGLGDDQAKIDQAWEQLKPLFEAEAATAANKDPLSSLGL